MRKASLVALLLVCAVGPASAAELPTADVIVERIRVAAGNAPATARTVVTYDASGLHGRRTTFRRGDDYREIVEEGPFTKQRGRLGKQAWHQNDNGQTVLDQPDPGVAAADADTTTVSAIATPVAGYVIARFDGGGNGTKEYVEAATWRVVRRDVVGPSATTTYAYDDFRTVAGVTRAWHWTVRDGHSENDAEYRLENEEPDVRAADVAIASSRGTFVEFPAGSHRAQLPVREERGKFYVRVTIGNRGLDFMLDTGASAITMDERVARELGLRVYGRSSNAVNAGRIKTGRVLVPSVAVGALHMHDVTMLITPSLDEGTGTVRAVGLLGFDFIGALALELDYQHATVTAFEADAFVAPTTPHTVPLDIRLATQTPMTDVTINGALGERFVIDTGASASLLIFDYFRRLHRGALVDLGGGAFRDRHFGGAGGAFETQPFQLASVRLGAAEFRDFLAFAVRSKAAYASEIDGFFGTEFLQLFNVYLDYANSRIYLEPNDLGRASRTARVRRPPGRSPRRAA
ncbi:MAG: hypothetical protein NVS3B16_00060 [Vulcanimicrobiaceae bacterium]